MTRRSLFAAAAVVAVATGLGGRAWAQEAGEGRDQPVGLEEVVVTARKSLEVAQEIPVAVTAVQGDNLANLGIRQSLRQIQDLVPGLTFNTYGDSQPVISLRGDFNRVGITEPGTGVFVDGVYQARSSQASEGPVDVFSVEVVKGPQGTLYGRNTITGAINIRQNQPTDTFEGEVDVGAGGSAQDETIYHASLVASGPLVADKLLARFVVSHSHREGFLKSPANGFRGYGYKTTLGRAKFAWSAAEDVEVNLTVEALRSRHTNGAHVKFFPDRVIGLGVLPSINNTTMAAIGGFDNDDIWYAPVPDGVPRPRGELTQEQARLQVDWTTPIGVLTSISAFNHTDALQRLTVPYPIPTVHIAVGEDGETWQQELRLAGESGRVKYIAGLYYLHDDVDQVNSTFFTPNTQLYNAPIAASLVEQTFFYKTKTKSHAAFAQLSYDITDQLNVTGGLRYSKDKKDSPQTLLLLDRNGVRKPQSYDNLERESTFDDVTGSLSLTWRITPDVMVYGSFAQGFKSGGFNLTNNPVAAAIPYGPQKLDAWELGLKSEFLDRRLRLNISAYYNDFSNLQVTIAAPNPLAAGQPLNIVGNSARAKVPGVDVDITAKLSPKLTAQLGYAYVDARITGYDLQPGEAIGDLLLKGTNIPRQPKHSVIGALTYGADVGGGHLTASVQGSWRSSFTNDFAFNGNIVAGVGFWEQERQPGYAVINLTGSYEFGPWTFSGYVRNLFNKEYVATSAISVPTAHVLVRPGEPRTVEVSVRRKF